MSKPPLWKAMRAADASCASDFTIPEAREIIALRDWLFPEEPQQEPYVNTDLGWLVNTDNAHRWAERQRLRALLTAEADRAERGND